MWWQIVSVAVAIIAILATVDFHGQSPAPPETAEGPATKSKRTKPGHKKVVYVIGDLHGDVDCAKHWVERIGVVDNVEEPKRWMNKDATLVFMGDYIDKGPFSLQTLLFVKSLHDAFPSKVTALMGNHEMEILKDRHSRRSTSKYYHMSYAVVHPQEFRNFITDGADEKDELAIDLLLNASMEIYARQMTRSVRFAPFSQGNIPCIVDFIQPEHRALVRERLTDYQASYERAFYSNTTLGKWVEQLKVAHVENGVLFTHGGVDDEIAAVLNQYESINALNQHVVQHAGQDEFFDFLQTTRTGQAIEKMLFYRGNHKGSCAELQGILDSMIGVNRLAVGHTPDSMVRTRCDDKFLALDSLLGRWIRTSGNYYCPSEERVVGNFKCPTLQNECQGQIVVIDESGDAKVIG